MSEQAAALARRMCEAHCGQVRDHFQDRLLPFAEVMVLLAEAGRRIGSPVTASGRCRQCGSGVFVDGMIDHHSECGWRALRAALAAFDALVKEGE